MFTADLAWAGPLIGIAALALRTYLKGTKMDSRDQLMHDQELLRDQMWTNRSEILDYLLLHDCALRELHMALLRLSGVLPELWIGGALTEDRDSAES